MKYTADFETTTDEADCRVWAYSISEIGNPNYFAYGNNMDDFMVLCKEMNNPIIYFHNLKFDGDFILIWLFEHEFVHVTDRKDLATNTFTTLISDKGQFYSIKIIFEKKGKKTKSVTIYDSLKILPFSVENIAKGFKLPISKLTIDYKEYRELGHDLTEHEVEYVRNDVTITSLALDVLFKQGLNKMTQGSNALHDYKKTISVKRFKDWFPIPDYDKDIRQSYRGGFTYLNPKYKGKDLESGIVLDVNSLYPSVMHDRPLPYGEGILFEGKYKEDSLYNLYIQMFTCQFELKTDHIPTVQLKNNLAFVPTEYLTSSEDKEITMCMTCVDLELFLEQYHVYNIVYHSGWKFKSSIGLFTEYIDKWTSIKIQSKNEDNYAMYILSKLMLNALYGKFALNPNVRSKIPFYDEGIIKYRQGPKETRDPIYIPVGSFVTSWARYKTITSAQSVYNRFVYADTDSLHLTGTQIPENLDIHPTALGLWKHEMIFSKARFLRQKSYIEYGYEVGKDPIDKWHIVCAGLPESCYPYVTWENFHPGVVYPGKLQMKHVKGGIILKDIEFAIKKE